MAQFDVSHKLMQILRILGQNVGEENLAEVRTALERTKHKFLDSSADDFDYIYVD